MANSVAKAFLGPHHMRLHDTAVVTESSLEAELGLVRAVTLRPVAGPFGPGSMMWQINRESILFAAAGRALLLQLAHPWVAAAIADHSQAVQQLLRRFHRTFAVVFAQVFGTLDQALAAARAAAQEQRVPGYTEVIEYEDAKGKWHVETAPGSDRPDTDVKDSA